MQDFASQQRIIPSGPLMDDHLSQYRETHPVHGFSFQQLSHCYANTIDVHSWNISRWELIDGVEISRELEPMTCT